MMKKILTIFSLLLAISACQTIENAEHCDNSEFQGMIENFPETKTTLSGNTVIWKSGDEIAIFEGMAEPNAYYAANVSADGTTCSFKLQGSKSNSSKLFDSNIALYPYSSDAVAEKTENSYAISGVSVPAAQTYSEGSFSNGAFPMIGMTKSAQDKRLNFKNVCGLVKLTLYGTETIKNVTLTGNNNEILSGTGHISISETGIPELTLTENLGKTITVSTSGSYVQLQTWEGTSFYFAVPPTEFENGFTFTIEETDGGKHTVKTDKHQSVKRSNILSMPGTKLDGTAMGGDSPVNIELVSADFFDITVNVQIKSPKYFISSGSGYKPTKENILNDFNYVLTNDLLYALHENPTPEPRTCSLTDFIGTIYPNQDYFVAIIPYDEEKTDYTIDDVYYFEASSKSVSFDGNCEVQGNVDMTATSYVSIDLYSENASYIFWYVYPASYFDQSGDYIIHDLLLRFSWSANEVHTYSDLYSNGIYYFAAVAMDSNGQIGKLFTKKITYINSAELQGWGVVGTFNNWSGPDVTMSQDGDWLIGRKVKLEKNAEVKFRKDQNWDKNYGSNYDYNGGKFAHQPDVVYGNPAQGGPNIIIPEAGTYDFYLSIDFSKYKYTRSN